MPQVGFTLRYAGGFVARLNRRGEGAEEDDPRVLALMFRDRFEWAVGHNTSVLAPKPDADGKVRALSTTQLPRYEVRGVRHEPVLGMETRMSTLGELDGRPHARARPIAGATSTPQRSCESRKAALSRRICENREVA